MQNYNIFLNYREIFKKEQDKNGEKKIAEVAQFFLFGTNDLTQITLGFSRDDVNVIINNYLNNSVLDNEPFNTLDQEGVGKRIKCLKV